MSFLQENVVAAQFDGNHWKPLMETIGNHWYLPSIYGKWLPSVKIFTNTKVIYRYLFVVNKNNYP